MNRFVLTIIGLLIATAAWGQIAGTGTNTGPAFNRFDTMDMGIINNFTTSGAPPACSNKLDFSVACNSQYIGVI